jgi:hypothetical protein
MSDRKRIAPTLKVKAKRQALPVQGTEENTPNGLPPGKAGRIEHMRAHAMSYFTTRGPRDETGAFLWNMADLLAGGVKAPPGGAPPGNQNARKKREA